MTLRTRIAEALGKVPVSPFLVAWFTVWFLYAENTEHVRLHPTQVVFSHIAGRNKCFSQRTIFVFSDFFRGS